MNTVFSEQDHARISDAIRAVERQTSGEIVTVAARRCEPYDIIAGLWAGVAALTAGVVAGLFWPWNFPVYWLPLGQIGVFLLTVLVLQYRPLRMVLVPRAVKHRRAARLARTAFLENNLHGTDSRAGILIFVAMAEHYVEIIADKGINDCVEPETWTAIVDGFTARMKRGETADGFVEAIEACGSELVAHFPDDARAANDLPDHLIEF